MAIPEWGYPSSQRLLRFARNDTVLLFSGCMYRGYHRVMANRAETVRNAG